LKFSPCITRWPRSSSNTQIQQIVEVVFVFALHADVKEQIRRICAESFEACLFKNGDKIQNVFFTV